MLVVVFYVRPDDHFRREDMQPPDWLYVCSNKFIAAAARCWEFQGPNCSSIEFTSYKGFIHMMTPGPSRSLLGRNLPRSYRNLKNIKAPYLLTLKDLVLSQQFCWKFRYSETLCRVDCEMRKSYWRNIVPVV